MGLSPCWERVPLPGAKAPLHLPPGGRFCNLPPRIRSWKEGYAFTVRSSCKLAAWASFPGQAAGPKQKQRAGVG